MVRSDQEGGEAENANALFDLADMEIDQKERRKVTKLLTEFLDIFNKDQYDLGTFTGGSFNIKTTSEVPIPYRHRPIPMKFQAQVEKHFEDLLEAGVHETILMSDHRPLTYLSERAPLHANLARWAIEPQSYNVTIQYVKGKQNTVADAISRMDEDTSDDKMTTIPEMEDVIEYPVYLAMSAHVQIEGDPTCEEIRTRLERGDPAVEGTPMAHYMINEQGLVVINIPIQNTDVYLPVISEQLRHRIFEEFHSGALGEGHFNAAKTLAKMRRKAFWPSMSKEIYQWCQQCELCQRRRNPQIAYRQTLRSVTTGAVFTKFVIAIPIPDARSSTVAAVLVNEIITRFGFMYELVSDNGRNFTAELFQEVCNLLQIRKIFTTPYHSQSNGVTERTFRTFQTMLSKVV
ncbi:unnamed protein product [Caenorhabditis bovis]|uniref:RNA-directed DNA polymerase n=1 Tax=Caenorhabditis bovis TaxID=2654633 RepID=A0A8S1FC77_9PELO|nr:unnamed protein product [Caenorhabditis bovis]